jgi:ribosomal protein S18 acetylase RimI-like enzyme
MNHGTSQPTSDGATVSVHLRPETPEDRAFLFEVYASTRREELELTGWDEPTRQSFLDMQFKAMCQGYRSAFAAAEFSIILLGEERVGRMVVDRTSAAIRVVDLAVLPARRSQGIGTLLLQRACAEAAHGRKPVRLCVLKNNRAIGWYQRLGFAKRGDVGCYDEMEWMPADGRQAPSIV